MKLRKLIEDYVPGKKLLHRPYIIAEAGVNHECNIDTAKRLIDEACDGGADAIKFQSYKADTLASKYSPAYWDLSKESTESQYQLFSRYDKFGEAEYISLKQHCDQAGIEFMSTPFDKESARYLNELMDTYKISSSDITNRPFIEYICNFSKPILLSTGASNLNEIENAAGWIDACGNKYALMHCILNYPTADENANLGMILDLRDRFPNTMIGYSDHTLPDGMKNLEIATLLGAGIIEKHFTYDKSLQGNDHYHAMDKHDLRLFRENLEYLFSVIGDLEKHSLSSEEISRKNARRSLVAANNIPAGKIIKENDLTWKRPGLGISPDKVQELLGRTALRNIDEDTVLLWDMFSK